MVAALHAQRILEAWDVTAPHKRDNGLFDIELKSALMFCNKVRSVSSMESEQQAVLESAARQLSGTQAENSPQVKAGLTLLRHLRTRVIN